MTCKQDLYLLAFENIYNIYYLLSVRATTACFASRLGHIQIGFAKILLLRNNFFFLSCRTYMRIYSSLEYTVA